MNRSEYDFKRILVSVFLLLISCLIGYLGQPYIHDNSNAISVIITVFAVLAGFLVAIMTLVSVPGANKEGRITRSDLAKRPNAYRKLIRQSMLFWLYLLILALVFLSTLISPHMPDNSLLLIWIERAYLTFATLAFLYSLSLPSTMIDLQLGQFKK